MAAGECKELRRKPGTYAFGPYRLDTVQRTLKRDNDLVGLSPRLFDALAYLVENHARVVLREELQRAVWGGRHVGTSNLVMAISSLRKELQAVQPNFDPIETVPGQGYKFIADVIFEPARSVRQPTFADQETTVARNAETPRRGWRRVAVPVALLLVVGAGEAIWRFANQGVALPNRSEATFTPPPHSVAVLAFSNLGGDPKQDYFADGLSEELIDSLCHVGALYVAARQSAYSFKGKSASVQDIARRLNVGSVLLGSVRRSGGHLIIDARLLDGTTGDEIWSHKYDRDQGDILQLQSELAQAVTSALKVVLVGRDAAALTVGGTANPAAFDAHLKALAAMRRNSGSDADYERITALFDRVVELDPNYALAQANRSAILRGYAGQTSRKDDAFVQNLRNAALAGAMKAVTLAPELAEAHLAMGQAMDVTVPDFSAMEAEYARARELAPGSSRVEAEFGRFEVYAGHTAIGVAAAERAVALDPLVPVKYIRLAWTLYFARRPAEALTALQHARDLGWVDNSNTSALVGELALMQGDAETATRACRDERDWQVNLCLAIAHHKLGNMPLAISYLDKFRASAGKDPAVDYAGIYAQWGQIETALHWLEVANEIHDPSLILIRAQWLLDPLRQSPRYKAIERKLNFPL